MTSAKETARTHRNAVDEAWTEVAKHIHDAADKVDSYALRFAQRTGYYGIVGEIMLVERLLREIAEDPETALQRLDQDGRYDP